MVEERPLDLGFPEENGALAPFWFKRQYCSQALSQPSQPGPLPLGPISPHGPVPAPLVSTPPPWGLTAIPWAESRESAFLALVPLAFWFPQTKHLKVMKGALKSTSDFFFWWLLEVYLSGVSYNGARWPPWPWSPTFADCIGQHVRSLQNVYQGGSLHRHTWSGPGKNTR